MLAWEGWLQELFLVTLRLRQIVTRYILAQVPKLGLESIFDPPSLTRRKLPLRTLLKFEIEFERELVDNRIKILYTWSAREILVAKNRGS